MESALDHEQKMHDEMRTKEAGTAKELMLTQTELSECQVAQGSWCCLYTICCHHLPSSQHVNNPTRRLRLSETG